MKDEVLKRAMFSQPMTKASKNSGIMAGFEDMDNDEAMAAPEPEEEMSSMARTPQNPEILMNTLRGDMRSVDARYQELAQMVGDQAAQETPPEVLALLQAQLAQPQGAVQGGIGALPQSQGMTPPGGAPQQGMPTGMPPQGAMPPQGMESAPPFPQGASAPQGYSHGGSVAPATPDGLPPAHYQYAGAVNLGTRLATMGADKAAMLGQEANALGGQLLSRGFPQQFPAIFENLRGPGGRFIAEQSLKYPTLTQHLGNVAGAAMEEYPILGRAAGAVAAMPIVAGMKEYLSGTTPESATPERRGLEAQYEAAYRKGQPDTSIPMPSMSNMSDEQLKAAIKQDNAPTVPTTPPVTPPSTAPAATEETKAEAPTSTADFIAAQAGKKSDTTGAEEDTIAKTKALYKNYQPMFKELLGDTGSDMRTQAMLLLADAGFKYASTPRTPGTTPVSIFSEAFGNMPKGLAALAAQAKERDVKINTAALQQALTDVASQRKYDADLNKVITQKTWDYAIKNAENKGLQLEDLGGGIYKQKTKDGSYVSGPVLNPNSTVYKSTMNSRYTLNDANPFVDYRGQAPSTVVDNAKDVAALQNDIRNIDDNLSVVENLRNTITSAYSPGSWFSDTTNNLLVPLGVIKPNMVTADAMSQLKQGFSTLTKNAAAMNQEGRVSVQQESWARGASEALDKPDAFLKDPELAAKTLSSMETSWRNARQQKLTQLGYENRDFVMRTPSTGTQNDPFVIPSDPERKKQMMTYLRSTIGQISDPRAQIYIKTPRGAVQSTTPANLLNWGE